MTDLPLGHTFQPDEMVPSECINQPVPGGELCLEPEAAHLPPRDHVVTTYYRQPGKEPITHAYGPYTKNDALAVRRRMLKHTTPAPRSTFHVSVCKVLHADPATGVVSE